MELSMQNVSIEEGKQKVIDQFGAWTAHNIRLRDNVYTIGERIAGDEIKLRRIVQTVADLAARPMHSLRILDLACLEGLYAVECALHGASVVGIEGRKANIEKARFVKEVFSLDNLSFYQDDVRSLGKEKYGSFDVVLCLGILYHLDVPDLFGFIEKLYESCSGFVVIDTHVSRKPETSFTHKGNTYWGKTYREHPEGSSPEEKDSSPWASLDNLKSFWFTRPSLYNILSHSGFSSVFECHVPEEIEKADNRVTLVAVRGQRAELISSPLMNQQALRDYPEVV